MQVVTCTLVLLAFLSPQCAQAQLTPFYHLSTLDVTHEKDTRPSAFFMQLKTARASEQR